MPETTRVIRNKGIYRFGTDERKAFRLALYCSVDYSGLVVSKNFRYPDDKSFFGYAIVRAFGFDDKEVQLGFDNQLVFSYQNDIAQQSIDLANAAKSINPVISANASIPLMPYNDVIFELEAGVKALLRCVYEPLSNPGDVPTSLRGEGIQPSGKGFPNAGTYAPSAPYDPSSPGSANGDDGYTQPYRTGESITGNWYEVYAGRTDPPNCTYYSNARWKIPGATDPNKVPYAIPNGQPQACSGVEAFNVYYDGQLKDVAQGILSLVFEFVPD